VRVPSRVTLHHHTRLRHKTGHKLKVSSTHPPPNGNRADLLSGIDRSNGNGGLEA